MTILFEWLISNAITASLLALLAIVITACFPRRPALTHACWLLVLIKLVTPPVYHLPLKIHQEDPVATVVEAWDDANPDALPAEMLPASVDTSGERYGFWFELVETVTKADNETYETMATDHLPGKGEPASAVIQPAITAEAQPELEQTTLTMHLIDWWKQHGIKLAFYSQIILLSGSVLLFIITLVRVIRFENLLQLATSAPEPLHRLAGQIASLWGIRSCPRIVLVKGKVGPLLWQRWQQPLIVLPRGLIETLSESEIKTVLAHELNHYRRGDHLWRLLELAAVTLYWWLPTVWWVSRQLRQAEEECCDAGVVAKLPDGVAHYSSALVRSFSFVTESVSPCPALSSGLGSVNLLKRRLHMLHAKVERKLGIRGWFLLMAVAVVALPWGISLADDDDPPPPPRKEARSGEESRKKDRAERKEPERPARPVAPASPHTAESPAVPPRPEIPSAPVHPGHHPVAVPGQPMVPGFPGQTGSPINEELRVALESAVRQAELDLKVKRIKVKQCENVIRQREADVEQSRKSLERGALSPGEMREKQNQLDNARIEMELALVEVERGELALDVARQRARNLNRQPSPTPPTGVTTPIMPQQGVPGLNSNPTPPPARNHGGFGGTASPLAPGAFSGNAGGGGRGFNAFGNRGTASSDAFFRNFDRQNTGRIRREDVPDWMRERFFEITDTNKDGVVDQEEFSANYNKLWEPGQRPGMARSATRNIPPEASGRRSAERDPRDERIEQLERELREMRRVLENMKKPEGSR
jgi:beta-lactamase regulating signal transducer with metallopeptidase domain